MKHNIEVNRDRKEPSEEQMLKHQNFEDVLKRASQVPSAKRSSISQKIGWFTIGLGVFVLGTFGVLRALDHQDSTNEARYVSNNSTAEKIQKVSVAKLDDVSLELVETENIEELTLINTDESTSINIEEEEENMEPKVIYLKPVLASTITFELDPKFNLKEQYQEFEELSIYENLSFQPIDMSQQSMLKITWEDAKFRKEKEGTYFLELKKNGQLVNCPVKLVFEEDDYIKALEIYGALK